MEKFPSYPFVGKNICHKKILNLKFGGKISIIPIHRHPLLLVDPEAKGRHHNCVISQPWRLITESQYTENVTMGGIQHC